MLTIICGEDTVASRSYFSQLQTEFQKKGYQVEKIAPNQIEEVANSAGNDLMLFSEKKVYSLEHLTTFISRKKSKSFEATMNLILENKDIELIDWEEKSAREIKLKTTIKEFKPSNSVFQLQESCYPGNLKAFVTLLRKLSETQEEGYIYAMLCRHIRTLVLTRTNELPLSVPFWMKKKLSTQAESWKLEGLLGFYEGLARLDTSIKTSSNHFGTKKSLEMLGCYFLK